MKLSAQVRSSGYSIPGYEIEPQPQTVDGLNNNLKEERNIYPYYSSNKVVNLHVLAHQDI
jgi:hypothetical protein